jgi:hypothetical protein
LLNAKYQHQKKNGEETRVRQRETKQTKKKARKEEREQKVTREQGNVENTTNPVLGHEHSQLVVIAEQLST